LFCFVSALKVNNLSMKEGSLFCFVSALKVNIYL
jgi:hypothetical protein